MSEDQEKLDFVVSTGDDYLDDESPVITCPHCWNEFHLSQVNYIASHPTLIGDIVLGEAAQTRFLPTKFNAQGYAIDAKGMTCRDMACPRCHLKIPEILLEEKIDVLSIAGAPASGKSYFITAMTHSLKQTLPQYFDYSFTEADIGMNNVLKNYEDILFNNNTKNLVSLPKTELEGSSFTSTVKLQGTTVNLPLPFIFTIRKIHTNFDGKLRNVVFYDNAGEHFEAGRDSVTNLATMHLANSSQIMFLFDPFKDLKTIGSCNNTDPQANVAARNIDQPGMLLEIINRLRKFRKMAAAEKSDKTLVVIVTKFDAWSQTFPFDLNDLPYAYFDKNTFQYSLDLTVIKLVSYCTRQWLLERVPSIVMDSEAFFETVFFLPMSALGTSPKFDKKSNMIGIKPVDIKPQWAEVPIDIYLWKCGLISSVNSILDTETIPVQGRFLDNNFVFLNPSTRQPQSIPILYCGASVYDSTMGQFLKFPDVPNDYKQNLAHKPKEDSFWD